MQVPGSLLSLSSTGTLTMPSVRLLLDGGWVLTPQEVSTCPLCPDTALDPLGHHAATCRYGGDVASRHNHLRDVFADFGRCAQLSVKVEVGCGLSRDHINSRPADVQVQSWDRGKPAVFDVTVASPLTPAALKEASVSARGGG